MLKNDYQRILKEELTNRCNKNRSYSLRAFARDLDIEPAQLSRVLSGKQNISVLSAESISQKIFNNNKQKKYFISLVEYSLAKKPERIKEAINKVKKYSMKNSATSLELEAMLIISEWYHIPIMDLCTLPHFKATMHKISEYLGLKIIETKLAIERLEKLGLIERKGEYYKKTNSKLATPTDIPSLGIRKFHKSMIEKAVTSIEEQNIDRRYITSKTMTLSRKNLSKYKEQIQTFLENISELNQENDENHDSLYQLNIQLFDLKKGNLT